MLYICSTINYRNMAIKHEYKSSFDAIKEINRRYNDPNSSLYMNDTYRNKAINAINSKANLSK